MLISLYDLQIFTIYFLIFIRLHMLKMVKKIDHMLITCIYAYI